MRKFGHGLFDHQEQPDIYNWALNLYQPSLIISIQNGHSVTNNRAIIKATRRHDASPAKQAAKITLPTQKQRHNEDYASSSSSSSSSSSRNKSGRKVGDEDKWDNKEGKYRGQKGEALQQEDNTNARRLLKMTATLFIGARSLVRIARPKETTATIYPTLLGRRKLCFSSTKTNSLLSLGILLSSRLVVPKKKLNQSTK